ncbi:MAG: Rossmann-like and DUF2520 domain-containing protein, partial [Ginsengibacter sp.]
MRVVMLGSGNTATVLCEIITKAGHQIVQVISRDEKNAKPLAATYSASTMPLDSSNFEDADIYIFALNDAALDHIEKIPALKDKFVVHTAGAVSINVFKDITSTYGVLYPLQSLSKFIDTIPEIPFLIDGNTQENLHRVLGFAKTLSDKVIEANDKERLNYHIAAVFVNNFTNHLYALAELHCEKEGIDFKTLYPLIDETTKRAMSNSPYLTQTGPAIRDDIFTLNRHLQALASKPDLKYLYLKLTESIIKQHG